MSSSIGFGIGISFLKKSGGTVPTPVWILLSGAWEDSGVWIDAESWDDGV